MKADLKQFAPFGLYLALLAALAAIGIYFVQREMSLALQISLALTVVGLAVFVILDPQRVRRLLTGRQARYGSNALIMLLGFIGIVVVLNYLIFENPKRWDLTEDNENTLAQETLDTLDSLAEPVVAKAFFTSRLTTDEAKSLLDQYQFNADGLFDYEFIDPEANPVLAEQSNITRDGTIVLVMADQQEQVTFVSENELTSALVRLMNPEARTIYFLSGHGEYSIEDFSDDSYSMVKTTLENKNYTVAPLNLLAINKVPEDAEVIVIPGPRKPLSAEEVELLKKYLNKGGSVITLQEPLPVTEFGDSTDPLAEYLSADWGIVFGDDIVVDPTSTQPFAPYANEYGSHEITEKMQNITSVFPSVRSVRAKETEDGPGVVQLVLTAPQSWAETSIAELGGENPQVAFDEGEDTPGPIPLAVVAENFETTGKVVVIGDSDFAADLNFPAYGNGDLIINSVDWAAGREDLINLTPKEKTERTIIPPQSIMMNLILLGTVFVLPGLALLGGILVWVQRKRRG